MATRFKVGDTVRLKSGGPLMTVSSLTTDFDGHPVVNTTWFDKNDKECSGSYLKDMLTAERSHGAQSDVVTHNHSNSQFRLAKVFGSLPLAC
jgi:uncharacterized protein YodC (DUF2158 family)